MKQEITEMKFMHKMSILRSGKQSNLASNSAKNQAIKPSFRQEVQQKHFASKDSQNNSILPQIRPSLKLKQASKLASEGVSNRIQNTQKNPAVEHKHAITQMVAIPQSIKINTSILKRIEQKIYPLNKQILKKVRLRIDMEENNKISRQTLPERNNKKKGALTRILESNQLQKLKRKKRTKTQEDMIELQGKVEQYLIQKRKQLKMRYDENKLQQMFEGEPGRNLAIGYKKENYIQNDKSATNINKKIAVQNISFNTQQNKALKSKVLNQNSQNDISSQSQLKRVLKLFKERNINFTQIQMDKDREVQDNNLNKSTGQNQLTLTDSIRRMSQSINEPGVLFKNINQQNCRQNRHLRKYEHSHQEQFTNAVNKFKNEKNGIFSQQKKLKSNMKLQRLSVKKENIHEIPSIVNTRQRRNQSKALNNQLIASIITELFNQKNNLMRKKINHGKLIKNRKHSLVLGTLTG